MERWGMPPNSLGDRLGLKGWASPIVKNTKALLIHMASGFNGSSILFFARRAKGMETG